MAQTHIVNMILDTMVSHLTTHMQTNVTSTDITWADVVKKGLLQVEKTKKNIQIGLTGGDHENPEYRDGIVTLDDLPNIGFVIDPREIGGGQMWMRRFVARIECFFIVERLDENAAHAAAYEVLGRLMSHIEDAPVSGLTDSFGELAVKPFCFSNTFFESGGPPKSFIFRGKVLFQVMTERP